MCVSGWPPNQSLKMEEYVREWSGHCTRVFKMEEYVHEWHGHHTRVFITLMICS